MMSKTILLGSIAAKALKLSWEITLAVVIYIVLIDRPWEVLVK